VGTPEAVAALDRLSRERKFPKRLGLRARDRRPGEAFQLDEYSHSALYGKIWVGWTRITDQDFLQRGRLIIHNEADRERNFVISYRMWVVASSTTTAPNSYHPFQHPLWP